MSSVSTGMTTLLPVSPVGSADRPETCTTELPLEEISNLSTGQSFYCELV